MFTYIPNRGEERKNNVHNLHQGNISVETELIHEVYPLNYQVFFELKQIIKFGK